MALARSTHDAPTFRAANSLPDALGDAAEKVDNGTAETRCLVLEYDNGRGDIRYGTLADDAAGSGALRMDGWTIRYIVGGART